MLLLWVKKSLPQDNKRLLKWKQELVILIVSSHFNSKSSISLLPSRSLSLSLSLSSCVYVCVDVCACTCTCECVYRVCIHMYECACADVYVHLYVCAHLCRYGHVHLNTQ